MSYKIYEAYRVYIRELNGFLCDIRNQVYDKIEEIIIAMMNNLSSEHNLDNIQLKLDTVLMNIRKKYEIDDSFMNYVLRIYIYNNYAYIIPMGINLKIDYSYVKNYSYWNNIDKPEDISNEEWDSRGKTWDNIFNNITPVYYPIIYIQKDKMDLDLSGEIQMRIIYNIKTGMEVVSKSRIGTTLLRKDDKWYIRKMFGDPFEISKDVAKIKYKKYKFRRTIIAEWT